MSVILRCAECQDARLRAARSFGLIELITLARALPDSAPSAIKSDIRFCSSAVNRHAADCGTSTLSSMMSLQ